MGEEGKCKGPGSSARQVGNFAAAASRFAPQRASGALAIARLHQAVHSISHQVGELALRHLTR